MHSNNFVVSLKHQKKIEIMKTIKEVTCPICEGEGFTIEIEAECCGNFIEPFECCMVPDAIQVQKECSCNNGLILIEE